MHAPQGHGRRLRPGGHPRVWALIVAMGFSALALTLVHVRHLPALGPHPRPSWWLLAVAFAVAELCVVHVEFRRNVHIFSLSELPLVFGLIFAKPWAMLLGILLGPMEPHRAGVVFVCCAKTRRMWRSENDAIFASLARP